MCILQGSFSQLCNKSTNVLHSWYTFLSRELGEITNPLTRWESYKNIPFRIRTPIHISLLIRLQAELTLDHIGNPVCHLLRIYICRWLCTLILTLMDIKILSFLIPWMWLIVVCVIIRNSMKALRNFTKLSSLRCWSLDLIAKIS